MDDSYQKLMHRARDLGRLSSIGQLLEWDQETYMPPKGVEARAELMALIAGLAHEQLASDEMRRLLDQASQDMSKDEVQVTNVRELRRRFDRAVLIPTELVKEIAHATAVAKSAWSSAREHDEFETFAPHLKTLVGLKQTVARHVGFESEPYDALIDEFEPGARASDIEPVFAELRAAIVNLMQQVDQSGHKPDASILARHFPRGAQESICRYLAQAVAFDFEAGRMDVSVHPFCLSVGGGNDVRITTRFLEDFLPSALFGTLHEAGHALYEQGLPAEHRFTPRGDAVSLGIHESQSRLWENMVGRGRPFWERHYARLQQAFAQSLGDVSCEDFYRAINVAQPSLIRVEADELTYNLHIIVRFDIERALIGGELDAADVPDAWRSKYQELLGVAPQTDTEGCLQDIHWSLGIFGYFPTYALGNLFAAQFFEKATSDLPDLDKEIAAGNVAPLLGWLRSRVHRHGQRYRASELVEVATGRPLSIEPFVNYMTAKLQDVYRLA